MSPIIAQGELVTLGSNPKTWIVVVSGMVLSMIVGRFVQAFRNGEGIKGAATAVWLGTNTPKKSVNVRGGESVKAENDRTG